ncbi:ABC transporter ATP-binding protein [Roseomonas elaeocarpi]|uniref:ABC transporter ATP-binding protein n=1 Tax=Roseomonas elaeocarpi TaxID=907779 RepID=A0ABV6JW44_9PROT
MSAAIETSPADAPLIEAKGLSKTFGGGFLSRARPVQAVRGIDAGVRRGEALGVVGESGSGKSTLGRLMLGLMPATGGTIRFDGVPVTGASGRDWRQLRRRMQIVFQDPFSSLDPRRRVGPQIADGLLIHGLMDAPRRDARVAELLTQVGLDPSHAGRFPHEFSGGQRQRIGIARALATGPEFLVADEPVSALDVSIQAQVVNLLADLRQRLGLALLFISHDLPVVRHLCDRVLVMYLGRVMEEGPAEEVFSRPRHPYTRALLSATPRLDPKHRTRRILLTGDPPSPSNPPSGCVFRTRCAHAQPRCAETVPELREFGGAARVACVRAEELN